MVGANQIENHDLTLQHHSYLHGAISPSKGIHTTFRVYRSEASLIIIGKVW